MIYEGEWQMDRICGKGRLRNIYLINKRKLSEDSVLRYCLYDGYFHDNRFHGDGALLISNGDKLVGQFSEGTLIGQYSFFRYEPSLPRNHMGDQDIGRV